MDHERFVLIRYEHTECTVNPTVTWYDVWSCTCNGQCPACGMKDIEPIEWKDADSCFE
jgi:hypothetical protein